MELINKRKLTKYKRKNQGNIKLLKAIDKLIADIEKADWKNKFELLENRPDADKVHNEGFYFFNINVHRTMILIVFDEQEAEVIWVGSHKEYEIIFKNNKKTIENWLRTHGKIE